MTFREQVKSIHQRIFNEDYHAFIQERYQMEQRDSYFQEVEGSYQEGAEHLTKVLDSGQRKELAGAESRYTEQRSSMAEHGFYKGLYAAFDHYFHQKTMAFDGLIRSSGMEMDELRRHPELQRRSQELMSLLKHLRKGLSRDDQEHLVSIECA